MKKVIGIKLLLALILLVMIAPCKVQAEENKKGLEFDQTLQVDQGVYVPTITFTYDVKPIGSESLFKDNDQQYPVLIGMKDAVTIDEITFKQVDALKKEKNSEYDVYNQKGEMKVDESKFERPGIYGYTLQVNSNKREGFTNKAEGKTYDLYVFIKNKDKGSGVELQGVNVYDNGVKVVEFQSSFKTKDLKVSKSVTGNHGDKEKEFPFTVTITNKNHNDDTVYKVIKKSRGNQEIEDEEIQFKKGVTNEFNLKHDESIHIYGLSIDDHIDVQETCANEDGYVTNFKREGIEDGRITSEKSASIVVENNRETSVPTGINEKTTPYLLVLAGAVFVGVRKFKAFS